MFVMERPYFPKALKPPNHKPKLRPLVGECAFYNFKQIRPNDASDMSVMVMIPGDGDDGLLAMIRNGSFVHRWIRIDSYGQRWKAMLSNWTIGAMTIYNNGDGDEITLYREMTTLGRNL